jgi:hypothetical protein
VLECRRQALVLGRDKADRAELLKFPVCNPVSATARLLQTIRCAMRRSHQVRRIRTAEGTMTQAEVAEEFSTKHFVEAGQARVCYRKTGQSPALVLLHGFPLSGLTWRSIVPALAPRFTCYALDLVGLGDTTSRIASDFSSEGQGAVF